MHHFNIRDVENLSGIKAHTLRIWEQRYKINFCKRKESRHRYYDNDDLKQILRIAHLYHKGYKISKIAELAEDDILSLTRNQAKGDADAAINKLVESALDYDETRFEECIQEAITDTDLLSAVKNVIYPFMDMVGLLWLTNHVIPGQEHFSSAIIRRKIIAATDRLPRVKNSGERSVLVFTPSGEEHEIPILIAQYILRKNKVQTVFAGADTTVELLEEFCRHHPATHLYFHLITNFTEKSAGEYLTDLCNRFPETKIIASGPAMKDCAPAKENCIILRSFDEMADYCSSLK